MYWIWDVDTVCLACTRCRLRGNSRFVLSTNASCRCSAHAKNQNHVQLWQNGAHQAVFQDLNEEVLENCTAPNIALNTDCSLVSHGSLSHSRAHRHANTRSNNIHNRTAVLTTGEIVAARLSCPPVRRRLVVCLRSMLISCNTCSSLPCPCIASTVTML